MAISGQAVSHEVLSDDDFQEAFTELLELVSRSGTPEVRAGLHIGLLDLVHDGVQALAVPAGALRRDPARTRPAAQIAALRASMPAEAYQMLLVALRMRDRSKFIENFMPTEWKNNEQAHERQVVAFTAAVAVLRLVQEQHAAASMASRWVLLAQLTSRLITPEA